MQKLTTTEQTILNHYAPKEPMDPETRHYKDAATYNGRDSFDDDEDINPWYELEDDHEDTPSLDTSFDDNELNH